MLGDQHSATFAAETACGLVAELEHFPMGVQRPFHYRLTWLCSSAVRYHLRFLMDPPPPSPSVPSITGYQPQYNCRSSVTSHSCDCFHPIDFVTSRLFWPIDAHSFIGGFAWTSHHRRRKTMDLTQNRSGRYPAVSCMLCGS